MLTMIFLVNWTMV